MKKIIHFWCDVYLHAYRSGCSDRAAALSFTTLLSLVPLATVGFSILSAFPAFSGVFDRVEAFVFKNFVTSAAQSLQAHIHQFLQHVVELSAPGLFFLLVTSIFLVVNMELAFNGVWKVKRHRRGVTAFLMYWAIITLTPILIGLGLAMSSYVLSLPWLAGAATVVQRSQWFLFLFPMVLSFVAFLLLYQAVPNCRVPFRSSMLGATVAALLFELGKHGFALYITHFPTYRLLYGAMAAVPIFLLWLYLCWWVTLFGVAVSYVDAQHRKTHIAT